MLQLEVFEDLDEKCTYTLHDPDDRSVMCNANGIYVKIPIQFCTNEKSMPDRLLEYVRVCKLEWSPIAADHF